MVQKSQKIRRVGVLTGGGDCPGLNSVLYGIMLKAFDAGIEVVGIERGWKGVLENITMPLNIAEHDDLHTKGGTYIYTSRTNPFKAIHKMKTEEEKEEFRKQIAQELAAKVKELDIDALITIGGDDTNGVSEVMYKYAQVNVVGCQKPLITI